MFIFKTLKRLVQRKPESSPPTRIWIDPELARLVEEKSRGAPSANPEKNLRTMEDVHRAIQHLPKLGQELRELAQEQPLTPTVSPT